MKSDKEILIIKLKKYMIKNSLSQEKIARLLGVSVRTVFRWVHGQADPSELAKEKIQKILKSQS